MTNNYLNDMLFRKLEPGKVRLTMNGKIAIKTATGYKSYNYKTNQLTNQSNFVFDIGDDMFFVIPTTHVKTGDVILVAAPDGRKTPRCVKSVADGIITVFNYETGTIEQLVPERHIFMGNTYFYGKIVSPFTGLTTKGKDGMNSIFKMMMMSRMFGGDNQNGTAGNIFGGGMQNMFPMMMLMNSGEMGDLFNNMLGDISFDESDEDATEVTEDETEE